VCHYFAPWARFGCSWVAFGEDETISRNKETINNPAITAPINITTPPRNYFVFSTPLTNVLPAGGLRPTRGNSVSPANV